MLFSELDIKSVYDSRKSDVYNDFFNTVLPHSNYYRRFGGIFSAKRFALIAEGLQEFIKENNGTMELAIIPVFSDEDKDALMRGISVDDVVTKNWIRDLSEIQEKFLEDHKKALSWMIANGYLTIKLILPEHENGVLFNETELKEHSIFRKEIGIFYNKENKKPISFHGFIDRENSEVGELYSIDVSRYWIKSEEDSIDADHEEFTNYWDNDVYTSNLIKYQIRPLSKKLQDYFKEIAPKTKSEIPELKKLPILRDYQNKAINEWEKNGRRGIFEMATGTGKTFTAIGCIKNMEQKVDKLLVVIVAPYTNLVDQWKQELSKWFINSIVLDSGKWTQILRDEVYSLNKLDSKKISVIIASHSLFANDEFVKQIENCEINTMLIVDESHHIGASALRNGLSQNYRYRLALSATIERYFDGDGTEFLRDYFSGPSGKSTVFTYSLKKAIDDGKLCEYNYYPFFVELTADEYNDYKILTYQAIRLLKSKDPEARLKGERLIEKRALIIRDATNKIDAFKEILTKFKKIKHTLIFCSEKQFNSVDEILENPSKYCGIDTSILFRKITYENPPTKKERIKILNEFANEDWDVLTSNRVLDEGMDVPQARNCIILASTGNPTQFIQRRGRVLRTYDQPYKDGSKKEYADIYDVLVRPNIDDLDLDSKKLEIGMIRNQYSRIRDMSELARNKEECLKDIKKFTSGLPIDIFETYNT